MVVSMIQLIIELPDVDSLKEKRRVVNSLKEKLQKKFRLSVAEVDLQDSLGFSQIGGALVSNSKQYGESVLQKALTFIENEVPGRLQDVHIHTERF